MPNDLKKLFKVSEIEITYRNKIPFAKRIQISAPEIAYNILLDYWDPGKIEFLENFKILLLDQACNCLGISDIVSGGMNSCVADPRIIFATALKSKATRLIMAHNHPGGALSPSDADIAFTKRIATIGSILEIPVMDHLIVTPHGYYSFAEHGLIEGFEHIDVSRPQISGMNGPS